MIVRAESVLRNNMKADLEFGASDQWDPTVRAERAQDGRPCLTINRLPQFIRQVTNQQRAARPAIQVNPVDSGSDPKVAEVLQGIIRNIEINSDADVAYSTAGEFQVTCGRGYWLVTTEFAGDDGYEQVIRILTIRDPLSVFVDPGYSEVDGRDARFGFIVEDIPAEYFEEKYGEDAVLNYKAWINSRSRSVEWMAGKDFYRVAHYFYLDSSSEDITDIEMPSIENPQVREVVRIPTSRVPKKSEMPPDWKIKGSRVIVHNQCKWALITPTEVLDGNEDLTEGRDFPSRFIPIVHVHGSELNIDGEVDLRGMVRDAKDPQKMYSFWASALTEVIALTPRAPYIGYEGAFKGHTEKWNQANRKNFAFLEVNPVTIGGQPAPFPQRQAFSPAIEAIVQAFQLSDNDMKAVVGLYDASLGKSGPEQSGKAILARQSQGQLGNSNFMDNLSRSIRHTGRIILDMIPRVYTPLRILRILGADNKTKNVIISNGAPEQDVTAMKVAQGIPEVFDISVGRYDVSISAGSSEPSRRAEMAEALMQLINSYPDAAPIIMDLMVKNMDWPGADEIAERLRRNVPSNLLSESEGGKPAIPPDVVKHMKEMEQEIQKLQMEIKARTVESQQRAQSDQADIAAKERMALESNKTALIVAQLKEQSTSAQAAYQQQLDALQGRLELMFSERDAAASRQHEAEQQQAQREHDAQQQEQQRQHEAELAKQQQKADAAAPPAGE